MSSVHGASLVVGRKLVRLVPVNFTVPIPDELARRLSADGGDIARRALEAFAVEEYRAGRLTQPELRQLLGFATRSALDAFLKDRNVHTAYGIDDLEQDRHDLSRIGL